MTCLSRLAALLLVSWLPACAAPGEYHGTVVDAETRAPLEGVVVVVFWGKKPYIAMDGPEYFHDVREAVTDREGRFSMPAGPRIDWNPFTYVKTPDTTIYLPGYKPQAPGFGYEREFEREQMVEALLRGDVFELRKFPPDAEIQSRAAGLSSFISGDTPFERIPHLHRLVNEQARRLGLSPYPAHR